MSGYNTVLRIRQLEERVSAMGLALCPPRYTTVTQGDMVSVKPVDENLPLYNRDAEIWTGTLEGLEQWLNGVEWSREYDRMLGISSEKKRAEGERRYNERQAVIRKKQEQKRMLEILKTPSHVLNIQQEVS